MPYYKTIPATLVLSIGLLLCFLLGGCESTSTPTGSRSDMVELDDGENPESIRETAAVIESPTLAPSEDGLAPSTDRPTATPVSSQEPPFLDLLLGGQGFGQAGLQLAYGFELTNPNATAVSDSVFRIFAYDENGNLLGTEVENIPLLLPDQLLGIAGSLDLDDETVVEEIMLEITAGEPFALDVLPELEVIAVNYRPSEIYERVSGLIGNDGDIDLEDIRISAIAYDPDSQIVGAGYAFLSFLPADSTAGIDIVLTTNEPVERIGLYPRVSLPTLLQNSSERPRFAFDLDVLDSGFSQEGIEVGYGFLVANPNPAHSLENTEYRVTFFNEQDAVVAVDEGYIDLLVPRQFFGIGDHVFVDEGETVGRMEVLARPSHYQPATPKPLLTAENVTIFSDTLGTVVNGEINNPYQVAVDNVRVTAVVYDDQGRLIGGGYDWLETIPPAGLLPVEVRVSAGNSSVSAELYASIDKIIRE